MTPFDFNPIAKDYDNYYQTGSGQKIDAVEKRLVKKYLNTIPEKEALEIGCGTGHWSMFFSDQGFQITGIDIADNMIRQAVNKNIPGAVFIQMNAENLMFPNESIKNIFTIATAEFTHNQQKFFDESFRVLKRNGYFLIGALNANSPLNKKKENDPVFKDANFFTPTSLKGFLNRFGHAETEGCAVISETNQVLDYPADHKISQQQRNNYGAFLVGLAKKL
ncbi:MAG: class I SAM-dependent methyltransferase [Bacteroidales bacterium]